ncbi:MAG: polyprenyl synthetase family protein [Proteobacteria bacterium]|nr:polyprenyl synthetase family protein [Pseudomonadota bacterium]
MDVQAWWAERLPRVERELDAVLPAAAEPPQTLHAAMRHLVFPGGKRLRPAFAMAAAEAVGAPARAALPAAVGVELVHAYSLIHDDLPCMDDDDERRGRPTVHVAFGEAVAVLAGDALQALAFQTVAAARPAESAARVVHALAAAAGSRALVGGQVDDLAFDPENRDTAHIESVHARKSGALIAVSVSGGARLAGADDALCERLHAFGLDVGVAFQIQDDVLDEGEDDACSLVRAIGREGAAARAEELLSRALARLEDLGSGAEPLRELARYAVRREK